MSAGQDVKIERWWDEHAELDRLVRAVADTLAGGSRADATAALRNLADALESHFAEEEDVYFPLIVRLQSRLRPAVESAKLSHARIREHIEESLSLLTVGDLRAARTELGVLLACFREHEVEETELIQELRRRD